MIEHQFCKSKRIVFFKEDNSIKVREEEKWRQCKRSSEIRIVSLGLHIIGEGITVPSNKRRKKGCLVMEEHQVQIGVYKQVKFVAAKMKGVWEASPTRPPMEG
ncbi:uncharacterized protein G2W53_030561 [Senna tora]|uniref:Uncharacterized protein n=1 Tax=Senna tora TaxID=362788 RepID=A0A834WBQ2_9FABA|nr:uncharacterized protein G2W53_030561 [Senna tora]